MSTKPCTSSWPHPRRLSRASPSLAMVRTTTSSGGRSPTFRSLSSPRKGSSRSSRTPSGSSRSEPMIPKSVELATRLAALWVKDYTDDWVTVKEEILTELTNEDRQLFSRRDPKSKEILALNDMELELVVLWKQLTGIELRLRTYKERSKVRW